MRRNATFRLLALILAITLSFSQGTVVSSATSNDGAAGETTDVSDMQAVETVVETKEDAAIVASSTIEEEIDEADEADETDKADEAATVGTTEKIVDGSDEEEADESPEDSVEESVEEAVDNPAEEEELYSLSDISFPDDFRGMVDDGPAFIGGDDVYSNEIYNSVNLLGASQSVVNIDVTGTFYTLSADTILNQINKIRKEAYDLGFVDRYVPIKWSATLEECARIRALEAGLTVAHQRLASGVSIWDMPDSSEFYGRGENLAWNNNHDSSGITYGINQFYKEKAEYIKELAGKDHGVTGHYTSMINPDNEYVGVGACLQSGTPNGWITVAMRLGGRTKSGSDVDQSKDSYQGKKTYTVPADASRCSGYSVSGPGSVNKNSTVQFSLNGKYTNSGTAAFVIPASESSGIEWTSSDPEIATVSGGTVTGVSGGSATITATMGAKSAGKSILVKVPLEAINLHCDAIAEGSLNGGSFELVRDEVVGGLISVEYLPEDVTDKKAVTWKSSNTKVVTVDSRGNFKLLKAGTATITATASSTNDELNPIKVSFDLTVKVPITDIKLSKENATLNYTSSKAPVLQLTTSTVPADAEGSIDVVYTSSDPSVATVSETGLVTAVSGGTTTIIATAGSFSKTCEVTVIAPVKAIVVSDSEKRILTTEEGAELTVTLDPLYTSDRKVTFKTSDPEVFTVSDGTGSGADEVEITAVDGIATVTVNRVAQTNSIATLSVLTSNSKVKKNVSVVIVEPIRVTDISFNRSEVKLYEGESYSLNTELVPTGTDADIVYASSNTDVVTVDTQGNITAVGVGKAEVTASVDGIAPAACTVTVIASDVVIGDTPYGDDSTDGIWIAAESFRSSVEYTGAKITHPNLRVYYGKKLLEEKTDYTVAYKNNINAAASDAKKAPQMIVTLKGQYQGSRTVYFSITPVDISGEAVTESGKLALHYNKKPLKPVPELYFASKKLANKKDFVCEYPDPDSSYTDPTEEAQIVVNGRGNFTGQRVCTFSIVASSEYLLSKAAVTITPSDPAAKKIFFKGSLSPSDLKVTVKIGKTIVDPSYYEITSLPNTVGKGKVTIAATSKGMENGYNGFKTVTITTYADRNIKDVLPVGFQSAVLFDPAKATAGGMKHDMQLMWNSEILEEKTDYKITYYSNTKVGTAKVRIDGCGRYAGSRTLSFKILPCTYGLTVDHPEEMSFTKGGVTPAVTVTYAKDTSSQYVLSNKSDYSVAVIKKSNLKPGTMQFQVVGKGNYKGYKSDVYEMSITSGDLKKTSMVLSDKAYAAKGNGWKSSAKIVDINGKALTAGKDYDKNLIYYYEGMTSASVPSVGTTVFVTAIGKGDYAGSSITRAYRIFEMSISKLSFVVDPDHSIVYTGREIEPMAGVEIHAYSNSKDAKAGQNEILPDGNYVVVGYAANVKAGTGKITVKGIGNYGATKLITFKIGKVKWN